MGMIHYVKCYMLVKDLIEILHKYSEDDEINLIELIELVDEWWMNYDCTIPSQDITKEIIQVLSKQYK